MIVPKKNISYKKTFHSVVFTLTVGLAGYALLQYMNAPDSRTNREIYREINMTDVMDIPRFEPVVEEIEHTAEQTQTGETQPETRAPTPPQPRQTPRRVDLSQSLSSQADPDFSENRPRTRNNANESEQQERSSLQLEDTDRGQEGGLRTLRDQSSPLRSGNTRIRGSDGDEDTGLQMESGSGNPTAGNRPDFLGSGQFQGDTGKAGDSDSAPEVGLRQLEATGQNQSSLDDILAGLLEWMRDNPAQLPRPVRRLMAEGRWDPEFLTSRISITVEGKVYDILFMLKEELYEVHILLVENNQATYLIDRNFQKESNSLRVGEVQQYEGDIATISSQMEAASDRKAKEFYQIFLTWWESVQQEVNQ
ncbi:MAG: hypothetical protein WD266_05370 [Balneolales bacterium]